jgi:branched-chain amino acid transport system ATP-binding protein
VSLEIRHLSKSFGALAVTRNVSLTVPAPGLHAVIGPNGAGKTSLIHLIMGTLRPDAGQVALDGRDITRMKPHRRARLGLARTFQISQLVPGFTAAENVALAIQARLAHPLRPWGRPRVAGSLAHLNAVGLARRAEVRAAELSHGERRALEIATALALEPRCILLDEPLAGMGHDEAQAIIALLMRLKQGFGLLLVEHDMDAVFRLADRVSVLVEGAIIGSGTPGQVRADPAVRTAYLGDEC